ncbi:DNA polymerase IV [Metallosphaera tengchongensis]|uniref:DNA-directed DNA polymerase n=1 Tax=Metallosphaera tengchongensis TaxID=1532350 RepID=A0A6N0NWI3_9CREN|nr:DNA polymerase IV [Metallosphaera tengchongensis]QKR00565.1 DNA polymerase IV [Metallosphaera tengchongensis]
MIVLFVDIDYFFAQVEEVLNPSLRGKPVVVCVYSGRTKDSGAVATSNYQARKLGIKAGMPIVKAKELGEDAVFLPMRKEIYSEVSGRIMGIISKYGDQMEVSSIDEAFLDITRRARDFQEAEKIAMELKREILDKEKITVTVGIGPNKVIAKIVADMNKPNGLGIVRNDKVNDFVEKLDISKVPGIGGKLESVLKGQGITTLGKVKRVKFEELARLVGKSKAIYLISLANNTYMEPVRPKEKHHKGRYVTLGKNTREMKEILPYLRRAIEEAFAKIDGLPREIYVVAIMEDLDIVSRGKSLKFGVEEDKALEISSDLLRKIIESDKRKLRRVGVRLGKVTRSSSLRDFLK